MSLKKINRIEVVVFDLGGTLIEYENVPLSWVEMYIKAIENINNGLKLIMDDKKIKEACNILSEFNTRLNPREKEYTANYIFSKIFEVCYIPKDLLDKVIEKFFQTFQSKLKIFPDAIKILEYLKTNSYKTAILTDSPYGMPTNFAKRDIDGFSKLIDYFLSSVDCGLRKPNPEGLRKIAKYFNINIDKLIFIGDERKDIELARNAGVLSVYLNRDKNENKNHFGEDYCIHHLLELKGII